MKLLKRYKAIFFDWDGTAVASRRAPTEEVVKRMTRLLERGVALIVISGTTYENIASGKFESLFEPTCLQNLFLGLGRGAVNYRFDKQGKLVEWKSRIPSPSKMLDIHRVCFELHCELLEKYNLETDIVFSRPGYCKIDLMVNLDRGEHLFFQGSELTALEEHFAAHGYTGGLKGLIRRSEELGHRYAIDVMVTSDAKYLEVGTTTKSDNVNDLYTLLESERGLGIDECCFWGDEFIGLADDLFGSDSYMITDMTKKGYFFDVSEAPGIRPSGVELVGGGISTFLTFLEEQAE